VSELGLKVAGCNFWVTKSFFVVVGVHRMDGKQIKQFNFDEKFLNIYAVNNVMMQDDK